VKFEMKLEILIPVFDGRVDLLNYALQSIKTQKIEISYTITILNDGKEDNKSKELANKYDCNYIFTGQRNVNQIYWRSAAWPFNIGIKQSKADLILLQEPEVYHIYNNSINEMVAPHLTEMNIATHLKKIYIDNNTILPILQNNQKIRKENLDKIENNYHAHFWYSLCLKKETLIEMRGISELMHGSCYDDGLFYDQLINRKIKFTAIDKAEAVHLYHPRINCRFHEYNKQKYEELKNTKINNKNIDWGMNKWINFFNV